ncbi:MAG: hypothetical protein LBS41_05985 [Streptococcaceae bacterium]|jgi:capsular polysaccharide biosynthesis protein|nr:hypothetical protein [Streptococcaceae bacterium]
MGQLIDLKLIVKILKKHFLWMTLTGLVVGGLFFVTAKYVVTQKYVSQTALLVTSKTKDTTEEMQAVNGGMHNKIITTYKDILNRPVILNDVAKQLKSKYNYHYDWHQLAGMISINNVTNSQVFTVNVKAADPLVSERVNNVLTQVTHDKISSYIDLAEVQIIQKAERSQGSKYRNPKLIGIVGFVVGFGLWFMIGGYKILRNQTIDDITFFAQSAQVPNLGQIKSVANDDKGES